MKLTIKYYDRKQKQIVTLRADTDSVSVAIPAQTLHTRDSSHLQPALVVNVNTDQMSLERASGDNSLIASYGYTELLADDWES